VLPRLVLPHPHLLLSQQVKDLQAQSSAWAIAAGNYLTQLEDYQRHVTKLIGPRTKVGQSGFWTRPHLQILDTRLQRMAQVHNVLQALIPGAFAAPLPSWADQRAQIFRHLPHL